MAVDPRQKYTNSPATMTSETTPPRSPITLLNFFVSRMTYSVAVVCVTFQSGETSMLLVSLLAMVRQGCGSSLPGPLETNTIAPVHSFTVQDFDASSR